jgi:hypothetical protein
MSGAAIVEAGEYKDLALLVISSDTLCVPCRYKNGKVDGPVIGPWVGSSWHFNEALEKPRFEDYNICYRQHNRFAYLGYGRTLREELGESTAEHLTEEGVGNSV